jgi:hypothetical protein
MVPPSFPLYAHGAVPFDVLRSRVGIREFTSGAFSARLYRLIRWSSVCAITPIHLCLLQT